MLKSVVIRGLSTAQNRSITLPFRDPSGPYFIKKADGFSPVKADINKTSYPDMDKDYFQGARVGGRTPAFLIGLRPRRNMGETVQSLRRALYRVLPPKAPVRITINDDEMPQTYIDAIVEEVGPTIFDKSTDVVVTLVSMDAYLTSTTIFKDQSYPTNTQNLINYQGDAPTPFELFQVMTRACTSVTAQINGTGVLTVTYPFAVGDQLLIGSTPGGKYLRRIRSGTSISLLDQITAGSLDLFFDAATDSFALMNNFNTPSSTEKFYLSYSAKFLGA